MVIVLKLVEWLRFYRKVNLGIFNENAVDFAVWRVSNQSEKDNNSHSNCPLFCSLTYRFRRLTQSF